MDSKMIKVIFILIALLLTGGLFIFSWLGKSNNLNNDLSSRIKTYSGAVLITNFGEIELQFATGTAPITADNFMKLSEKSFFNGTLFHRVTKDFIQGGDPLTKEAKQSLYGTGGPGYKFKDEVSADDKIVRGVVAMANSGPNTNGSQFFIVKVKEAPWLDGKHTIFARVTRGLDVVDKISQLQTSKNNLPVKPVVLERVILK